MLIFKEVAELVSEVKNRIGVLGDQDDSTLDEKRLDLLMQLVSYINSMEWISHDSLSERVRLFLRTRYSYEQVALAFNMTRKDAHKSISYAGDRLRKRIGSALALIREGHIEAAKRELAMLTGGIDTKSLFIGDITDKFPPCKATGVLLGTDCRQELRFLCMFSQKTFDGAVARLDDRTLRHILYVLTSADVTYLRDKEFLWRCVVDGSMTVDECIRALKDDFIWGRVCDSQG